MRDKYEHVREDNGESIFVDFDTMMSQTGGVVSVQIDGETVFARRKNTTVPDRLDAPPGVGKCDQFRQVSDAMGFGRKQLKDFEKDRRANGFSGVSFVEDKNVPGFYNVSFTSRKEWSRYVKHRGLQDQNGVQGGGRHLSQQDFERAKKEVLKKYGSPRRLSV